MTANVNDLLETKKNEPALRAWVKEVAKRTKPQRVVWCNGTKKEYLQLVKQMLTEESLIQLNQAEYPNCYLYRSHPKDVARSEQNTFICTRHKDDVGPTNNWIEPTRAKKILWKVLTGCMKSRTMYVIPYLEREDPVNHPVIAVEDIDRSLENIVKNGGKVVRGKMALGDMGFAAYHKDSEENVIGLWQSA